VALFVLGLGIGALGGRRADAGGQCPAEGQCSFKKPNLAIVLDSSSAMNADAGMGQTRWEAAVEAVQSMMVGNGGYFDDFMHFTLVRFGHDPDPANGGTTIPGDTSGLVDGVAIDVRWYDPAGAPDYPYFECNGQAVVDALAAVGPPPAAGIESWSFGGLTAAYDLVAQSKADHPADADPMAPRFYGAVLITHGVWTEADGAGMDAAHDPAIAAGDLLADLGAPTYVLSFGDPVGDPAADAVAMAGSTGAALDAVGGDLIVAMQQMLDDIANQVIIPECTAGNPRVMIVLDASSDMLNVGGVAGAVGTTPWDYARAAISSGAMSLFDAPVPSLPNTPPVEDLMHVGLLVYGGPAETELLSQYEPCTQDELAWALDPNTSCAAGCADPWGGPPITWTFLDGSMVDPPGFDEPILSHMPRCDEDGAQPGACTGSGAYVHLGLALASFNRLQYAADPPAPADAQTQYINLLVTTGAHDSTDAQVMSQLTSLYADGVTTYVLGVGALAQPQLDAMACWGSGGTGNPCAGGTSPAYDIGNQAALEQTFADILDDVAFDPCCNFNDCSFSDGDKGEVGEPDPIPPTESSSTSVDTSTTGDPPGTTSGVATSTSTGADSTGTGATSETTAADGTTTDSGADAGSWTAGTTAPPTSSTTFGTSASDDDESGGVMEDAADSGCGCRDDTSSARGCLLAIVLLACRRRREGVRASARPCVRA
jgi:hypothetical protein